MFLSNYNRNFMKDLFNRKEGFGVFESLYLPLCNLQIDDILKCPIIAKKDTFLFIY